MSPALHLPIVLVAGALLVQAPTAAPAQSARQVTVRFSDPARTGTVKATILAGNLNITGFEGKDVIVDASDRAELNDPLAKEPNVTEADNIITVSPGFQGGAGNLALKVPTATTLKVHCVAGDVHINNVAGEIDVNSQNASLSLKHISGVVMAHTLNGRIAARLDRVPAGKAISFSTMNGDIDVSMPADTRATVRLQTENGTLHNDFKVESEPAAATPSSKRVAGKINGGGANILIKTLNGSIHLRKTPEAQ